MSNSDVYSHLSGLDKPAFWKSFGGFFRGIASFSGTSNYAIIFNDSRSCAVKIATYLSNNKQTWIFRLDRPHANVNFNHININPHISGIKDPHIPLPTGALTASEGFALVCKVLDTIAFPLVILIDGARIGHALYQDYKGSSCKNTLKTNTAIILEWTCGSGGAITGASIGTAILPGVGTVAGGIIGAIGGGVGGSLCSSYLLKRLDESGLDKFLIASLKSKL